MTGQQRNVAAVPRVSTSMYLRVGHRARGKWLVKVDVFTVILTLEENVCLYDALKGREGYGIGLAHQIEPVLNQTNDKGVVGEEKGAGTVLGRMFRVGGNCRRGEAEGIYHSALGWRFIGMADCVRGTALAGAIIRAPG